MGKPGTGTVQGDWTAVYPQEGIERGCEVGTVIIPVEQMKKLEAQSSHRIHTASECGCSQPGAWLYVLNYHLRVGCGKKVEQGAPQMSRHCVG